MTKVWQREVSQVAEEVLDALNKGLYQKATRLWEKNRNGHSAGKRGRIRGQPTWLFPGGEGTLVGVVRLGSIRRLPTSLK